MLRLLKSIGIQNTVILVILCVILLSTLSAVNQIAIKQNTDQSAAIESVLLQAAVQCYALEGSYPPDLYYLRDNYGVILDELKYFYFYETQGSNILPKLVVIKR